MNTHGAVRYRAMKALRRHSWQSWPGGDLPDETGPSGATERPSATTA